MSDTRVIALECFLMLAGLLRCEPDMGDEDLIEIRSSNLCRRTGYQGIVAAVCAALAVMREA
jgi:carbon-monoxide dehydrogenase small subunit